MPDIAESLKPLDWEASGRDRFCASSGNPYSLYCIEKHPLFHGKYKWVLSHCGSESDHDSLEAAKLAAWNHYVATVKACFLEGVWG